MTKEIEFLEKQGYIFDKDKYLLFMEEFFSSEHKIKDICDLLSKYADQETEKLRAEVEDLKNQLIFQNHRLNMYKCENNELEERHKRDVCGFTEWIRKQIVSNSIKCYEDDGKFTLWKPYTPYGSRLTVVELYDYYKQKFEK